MSDPVYTGYTFVQLINYPALLQATVVQAGLSTLHHIDTSGSGASMEVTLWFSDTLTEEASATLTTIMASYSNPGSTAAMITACTTALQDDAKLILVLRARTINVLSGMSYAELQGLCTFLGITP